MIRSVLRSRRRQRDEAARDQPPEDSAAPQPQSHPNAGPAAAPAQPAQPPMATVGDRFAMQLLVLAEQQREALDRLEHDEQDPDRLNKLYEIDHAVTLMRRAARELRVLAEKGETDMGGVDTSLVDIIRMAASSIEAYSRIQLGPVAELAVLGYAADDVASLLAPLLDNATRYSPATVSISAHLTESGGVVVRVVDSGIGLREEQVRALNMTMARAVPPVDEQTSKHTGFPVVHRLSRQHGIQVHFTSRASGTPGSSTGSGTTAIVSLPAQLICEAPADSPAVGDVGGGAPPASEPPPASPPQPTNLRVAPGPIGPDSAPPPEPPPPERSPVESLPRRERASLRNRDRDNQSEGSKPPQRPLARDFDPPASSAGSQGSFADDLDSFTAGGQSGTNSAPGSPPHPPDSRPEN